MTITTEILDKIGFLRNNLLISKSSITSFPDFLGIGAQKSGTHGFIKILENILNYIFQKQKKFTSLTGIFTKA